MIDLSGRVAIVTGAGAGLGRAHAKLLARRGAKLLINDLGPGAQRVADEITAEGGEAIAFQGSVTDAAQVAEMSATAIAAWGQVDILVNNAGIVRDRSFAKMEMADFRLVVDVHLMGAALCIKAVWETMRAQNYGRIVLTTSSSGLYGNFGQANYSAAKMALVGLMQTLGIEGAKNNIRVNCLAPTAATAMTDGVLHAGLLDQLQPELVSPAVLALVREDAPTRTIVCAGAGSFETARVTFTNGVFVGGGDDAAETLVSRWEEVLDPTGEVALPDGLHQSRHELDLAAAGRVR
jgi:NAD(P)-dependent dehydrogenase (short-subunit alcohol dehydrogenase family)